MYCTKCGEELPDDSRFCHRCGSAVKPIAHNDTIDKNYFSTPELPPNPITTSAELPQQSPVDEGVYGLLGFILAFFVPVVGFILSIIGVNKKKNSGLAAAGIIISIILMILSLLAIVLIAMGEIDLPYSRYYW